MEMDYSLGDLKYNIKVDEDGYINEEWEPYWRDANFTGEDLREYIFEELELHRSTLIGADFRSCNMQRVKFAGANLENSNLSRAQLQTADPPLSADGQTRAQILIHVAQDAGVTAVYATQFLRTQQTVQPLATQLGLTVNLVDAADAITDT